MAKKKFLLKACIMALVFGLVFAGCDNGTTSDNDNTGNGGNGGTHIHEWGAWTQTKAPTATEDGEEKRVCTLDSSHVETRPIPKTGGGQLTAVTGISNLPAISLVGSPLTLSGTVEPENATNKTITWSGNGISNGVFTAPSPGPYTLTATIQNGAAEGSPYVKTFTVNAVNNNSSFYIAQAQGSWKRTVEYQGEDITLTFVIEDANWEFIHPEYGPFQRGIIIRADETHYEAQVNEKLQNDFTWEPDYWYEPGAYFIDTTANPRTLTLTPDNPSPGNFSAGTWTEVK